MPIDEPAMQDARGAANGRQAESDHRKRLLSGPGMCAGAAVSWGIAALAAVSVIADPQVAADFDSGMHTRNVAGAGWAAGICVLAGFLLLVGAVWRGPTRTRWISVLMLIGGIPLAWIAGFAFLLSR